MAKILGRHAMAPGLNSEEAQASVPHRLCPYGCRGK